MDSRIDGLPMMPDSVKRRIKSASNTDGLPMMPKKKDTGTNVEASSEPSVPGISPSPSQEGSTTGFQFPSKGNPFPLSNIQTPSSNNGAPSNSVDAQPYKGFFGIDVSATPKEFNKQFEDLTGFRNFDLSEPVKPKSGSLRELVGGDFQKKREESAEDKKHKVYMAEKPKVDKVLNDVYYGMITPEALKSASENPFTRNIVQNTVNEIAPEFSDLANPGNAEQASKKIAEKNRANWVAAEQQGVFGIDETVKQFADATTPLEVPDFVPNYSGGPNLAGNRIIAQTINGLQPSIQAIRNINFDDENQVSDATQKVKELLKFQSQYYTGAEREKKLKETTDILAMLDKRNQFNVSKKGISANVEKLNEPIATNVISQLTQIDQTGQRTDVNSDKLITEQFKWGLTLAEKQDPVLFKNVSKFLSEGKSVDPIDFSHITRLGQGVYNMTVTRDAATNPELIGKETNFDFATKAERKAQVAGVLGDYLQELGMGSMVSVPASMIKRMGKEKGLPEQLVNELAIEEQLPFYDAIPKSGIASAGVRGVTDVLGGITNTFSTFGESPVDSYLRKKSLNLQLFKGQQVPLKDDEGNISFSNKTQKDNDNLAIGIAEGGGQFLAQLALTYAGGGLLIGGLRGASLGALNPTGKLATSIIDYGGTALSMYAQTYGDSYQQYLEKTGDARLADTAAKIDATLNGVIETMLPTTQIARMGMKGLRREATDGIVDLLKKEGDISLLREKGRGILTRYVTGVGKVLGTELTEEELQNAETLLNEYIFSPQTAKDRNLLKESWDTFKATTVSLALPALFGGLGNARTRDFTTQSLHHAAINFEDYAASLKSLADKGEITEQEYNQGVKIIGTHRNSIREMPELDIDGNEIADADALKYALESTKVKVYNDKIAESKDAVQKEMWEAKKKAAEEVQRGILMPKAKGAESAVVEQSPAGEDVPVNGTTEQVAQQSTETAQNENTKAGVKTNENAETETTISNPTPQAGTTDEANAIVSKTTEEATGTGVAEKPLTAKEKIARLKQKKSETLEVPKVSEAEKSQPGITEAEKQLIQPYRDKIGVDENTISDSDVLKTIAEQAQNISGGEKNKTGNENDLYNKQVELTGSKDLVDAAIAKFPEKDLLKQPNSQEQGVGTKEAEGVSSNSNEGAGLTQRQINNREKSRVEDIIDSTNTGEVKGSNISIDDKDFVEYAIERGMSGREAYIVKDMVERLIKPLKNITDKIDPKELNFLTENVEDINSIMEGLEDARGAMFLRNKDIVDGVNKEAKRLLDYYSDKNNLPENKLDNEKTFDAKVDLLKKFLNGELNYLDLTKFGVDKKTKDYFKSQAAKVNEPKAEGVSSNSNEDNKAAILEAHLPKGGELKGVTEIQFSDNGEVVEYGTKTRKTKISVKGLSAEDIKREIEFEKKILAKSKKDVEDFNESEIWAMRGLTREEKLQSIKMHKQDLLNNEQTERIIIPFYEKHLELQQPINETTATEVSPAIQSNKKEPKGQGNKEAVQPGTESTGRPNAETAAAVLGKNVTATNSVDLIKEAVKNNSEKVEVVFKQAYDESKHRKLPKKVKDSLKVNKTSVFDVVDEADDIIDLVKNNKDIESIRYIPKSDTQETKLKTGNETTEVEKDISGGVINTDEGKMPIEQYVERARAVLNKLFPDATLETFENEKDFVEAGGQYGSRGAYLHNAKGAKKILLNLKQMREDNTGKTAFHEVIHPIVDEIVGDEMIPLFNELYEQLKDVPGFEKVADHVVWYNSDKIAKEGITELLAQVADGNISLDNIPDAKRSKIYELLNKIFEKLGLGVRFGDDYDFKSFASDIKQAFETGDVEGLRLTKELEKATKGNANREANTNRLSNLLLGADDKGRPNFQEAETPSEELKAWTDIVQTYIEENQGLSLKEVQDKVAGEWGDRSQDTLVEEAYNAATKNLKVTGKENGSSFRKEGEVTEKVANELSTQFTKRLNNFVDKLFGVSDNPQGHVRTLKDSDGLFEQAKKINDANFQASDALFHTRDGKAIGFNYDSELTARERFDIPALKQIGKGSDRTVFDLGNGKVLKVAHTARGLQQNVYEGDYYLKGIVPEVYERGLNYVVVDNIPRLKAADVVPVFNPEDGTEVGTTTAGEMLKELGKFSQKDFDDKTDGVQDAINKYGFGDILSYDLLYGDFKAGRNWGYKDGTPVHIDGGTFGGVDMISSHRGKAPLSDPEFREIYNRSRAAKKQLGDTDKFTKFQITMPDGTTQQVKPINADVVNGFYSPLEKTINETKFDKLPAKQWIDKFAKGEEAKWTGLSNWLAQQQGAVSKADIQKYLKDNRIQIVEVVKGDLSKSEELEYQQLRKEIDSLSAKRTLALLDRDNKKMLEIDTRLKPIEKRFSELSALSNKALTKFSDYQLSGQKENYKEVLVTMPVRYNNLAEYAESKGINSNELNYKLPKHEVEKLRGEFSSLSNFKSSHFDEPNILVHLRFNTRVDSEGNKTLFLEEIQSDFGQKIKREGFKQSQEDIKKWQQEYDKLLSDNNIPNNFDAIDDFTQKNAKAKSLRDKIIAAKKPGLIEPAPFVTDTNDWVKLGLKTALKEAIKEGADKIAWTNGEQQNDRYDLSKQVDTISYTKGEKEEYEIVINYKGHEGLPKYYKVATGNLEDYVGKEIAQKIIDGEGRYVPAPNAPILKGKGRPSKVLDNIDLRIGGKGMIGFYGSPEEGKLGIVGNVAKSLFKQEPKGIDINTGKSKVNVIFEDGKSFGFDTKKEAKDYADKQDSPYKIEENNSTQHSIDITPQLKAQVSEGLPLFMYNRKGEILGFTDPNTGDIYLNGEKLNPNTPIHEAGHLYLDWAEKNNAPLLEEGLRKIRNEARYLSKVTGKDFYQTEALKQGKKGSDAYNRYMEKEALAHAIGDSGAQFFMETKRNSFKEWAKKLWEAVGKYFGIKNKTPEEIRKMTLGEFTKSIAADILDPNSTFEKKVGSKKTEAEKEAKVTPVDLANVDSADNTAGITHARMQDLADEYGFDDYIKNPETIPELDAEAAKVLARDGEEAIKKIFRKISETANNASPVENRMLLQYVASLKAKFAKNPMDNTVLAALKQAREMIDISNSIAGKGLQSIKGQRRVVDTLDNWMLDKMESLAVDELPDEVKKDIVKKFDKFQEESDNSQKVTDEYEAEKDNLAAELAIEEAKKQRSIIRRKSSESLKKERTSILSDIREKLAKARNSRNVTIVPYANELVAIAPDITKLVKNLVESGIVEFEAVVDNVHDLLKDEISQITRKDVTALIGGRYSRQAKTKGEIETRVAELKKEAKLLDELERLQNGGEPKDINRSIKRNQRIKQLKEAIKDFDAGSSVSSMKTRYDAEIEQLEEDLKNKNYVAKKKLPRDMDSLMQKTNPELWKRTMDARIKRDELKQQWEFEKQQDELARRNWMQKSVGFLAKLVGTSQAIKAGIDDSVTFIQLGAVMVANPRLGIKSKIEAIRDISNQRYKRQLAQLHASPYWDLMEKSGLSITEPHSMHKERMEEMFRQNLLDKDFKIAGKGYNLWTNTGGIFERLFTSMSNNMRVGLFMGRVELLESQGKTFATHPQEFKDAASAVNNLTARAKINKNADSDLVRIIIWAPQMLTSSVNLLGISDIAFAAVGKKGYYGKLDPAQRKFALSQMGRAIGLGVLVMAAAAARGWEPDKDPTSSTFGTILVGQTRYSVFGRFTTIVKAIMQIILSRRTTDKGVQDLDSGKFGSSTGGTILGRFFRGKMTPAAGLVYDYKFNAKKNFFTYEPITLGKIPDILVTPMAVENITNGLEQDGAWSLLTRALPSIEGINIYDKRDWKKFNKPQSIKPDRSRSRTGRAGRKTERNPR